MPSNVGILTFHRSINYGSALQAYALKTYVEELGFDAFLIDYNSYNQENKNYSEKRSFVRIFKKIYHLLFLKKAKRKMLKSSRLMTIAL